MRITTFSATNCQLQDLYLQVITRSSPDILYRYSCLVAQPQSLQNCLFYPQQKVHCKKYENRMFVKSLENSLSNSFPWTLLKCKIEFQPIHVFVYKCLHSAENSQAEKTHYWNMWHRGLVYRADHSVEFVQVCCLPPPFCLSPELWWQHFWTALGHSWTRATKMQWNPL